jgi:hypothetical protein
MQTPIRDLLAQGESELRAAPRRKLLEEARWADDVPAEAGVYAVWEVDTPVYVGESSSLKARMSDIGRPINHTFARKTCKALLIPETSIQELVAAVREKYLLSFIAIPFGRAEVEEYLILRWRTTLINKPAKRLLRSPQYAWVRPV